MTSNVSSWQHYWRSLVTWFPCMKLPARHDIDLEPGAAPPSRPPYRLSKPEMDELQRQITALLEKGFIEPSKFPFGAPVFFFVKKADGSLRLVCDWRQLNKITIHNEACAFPTWTICWTLYKAANILQNWITSWLQSSPHQRKRYTWDRHKHTVGAFPI